MDMINYAEAKYAKLFDLARRVRGLQREEKKYRGLVPSNDKKRLCELERQLDELILTEIKEQKSKQQEIF